MNESIKNYIQAIRSDKQRRHKAYMWLSLLSLIVVCVVVWQLTVPAITMTDGPFCQYEEHRHDPSCYSCKNDEGHRHTQACYSCGNDDPEHVHTDDCYVCANSDADHVHDYTCLALICTQEENHVHTQDCISCGKVEHVHTDECYIKPQISTNGADTQSSIGGELDADIACVSSLEAANVKSGTEPFDSGKEPGTHEPGKDYGESDNIVRSFDVIGYDLKVTTAIDTSDDYRSRYRLMVQAVAELNKTDKKTPVDFDPKSFNNLTSYSQQTVTIGDKTYVIFLGIVDIATAENGMIPGTVTFTPKLNVNAMNDNDTIKTHFYAWLDYNKSAYRPDGGKYEDNFWNGVTLKPDPTVSSESHRVAASDENSFIVSAAPNLNIQLKPNYYCDAYTDVDITNHPNRAAIAATNGATSNNKIHARVLGFGITLQLYNNTEQDGGDNGNRGMKGIQIPDGDITFKLSLSGTKNTSEVMAQQPFMYDYVEGRDSNQGSKGTNGLEMNHDFKARTYTPAYCAPINRISDKSSTAFDDDACYDGGNWTIKPVVGEDGKLTGELLVTVKGYEISTKKVESTDAQGNTVQRYQFPSTDYSGSSGYSDIVGCFSSCYVQVVMPIDNSATAHTYTLGVKDYALNATSNGQSIEQTDTYNPQRKTTDDHITKTTTNISSPGTKSISHFIAPYYKLTGSGYPAINNSQWSRNISSGGGGPFSYLPYQQGGSGMNAADGWVPLSYDAAMFTRLQQDGTTEQGKRITAVNAFLKFDADGCEPVDIDKDIINIKAVDGKNNPQIIYWDEISKQNGYNCQSNNQTNRFKDVICSGKYSWVRLDGTGGEGIDVKYYYVAKEDGSNWTSDEEMSKAEFKTSDLRFFKSVKDLKDSGRVCVGVYMEIRGTDKGKTPIFNGSNVNLYMGFHAKTTSDPEKAGKVYDLTSEVVFWDYDSVCAAGGMDFSRDATAGGLRYRELAIAGKSYIDNASSINPGYERVKYTSPNVIEANDISGSNHNGCSYLIVGNVSTIAKYSTDLTSKDTKTLSVDEKRTMTYVLNGTVNIANGTAADLDGLGLTITDTLNEKTHIEPGTEISVDLKSLDGTALGSTKLKLQGSGLLSSNIRDADGKTIGHLTLTKEGNVYTYRFTNLQGKSLSGFGIDISYRAYVGEIGGDSATEVDNGETITSSATIRCDGDVRKIMPVYSNMSVDSFEISKLKATGLFKKVDTKRVETNSDISYTVKYLKSAPTKLDDLCILDVLPYNGDTMGSSFDGTYALSSVKFSGEYTGTPEVWVALGERGSLSTDCTVSDVACSGGAPVSISGAAGITFIKCTVDSDGTVTVPDNADGRRIVAVFVKGSLPEGENRFEFTLTLTPDDNKAGNHYYNRATSSDGIPEAGKVPVVAPKVVASVIQRNLSGMAWADLNNNGIREDGENGVGGIEVRLYRWDDAKNGYVLYSDGTHTDCLGRPISNLRTGEDGTYCFEALPAGKYKVYFAELTAYGVSPCNVGGDESRDSDAVASYNDKAGIPMNSVKLCYCAGIEGIVLKSLDEFAADDYIEQSLYNDVGLVKYSISALKLDLYDDSVLEGAVFNIEKYKNLLRPNQITKVDYWKNADWTQASEMTSKDDAENYLEISDINGVAQWNGLSPGKYYIEEQTPPDGYYKSALAATVVINADGTYSITVSDSAIENNRLTATNVTLDGTQTVSFNVYNDRGYELPESGGIGDYPFVIGGLLLMAAPLVYIYVRRKERRSEN